MPPGTLFTSHVTTVFEFPVTMAWNCCVAPRSKVALGGVTVTLTFDEVPLGGFPAIPQLIPTIVTAHKIPSATARGQPLSQQKVAATRAADRFCEILFPCAISMGATVKARDVPQRVSAANDGYRTALELKNNLDPRAC